MSRGVRTVREGVPFEVLVFLGGKEKSTLKEITEMLGKETIDTYNTSDTRGQSQSMGLNYQKLGKELI